MKCINCQHWQPRESPKGLAALGYAPCDIRSISKGHTFSGLKEQECDKFKAAADEVAKARLGYLEQTLALKERA